MKKSRSLDVNYYINSLRDAGRYAFAKAIEDYGNLNTIKYSELINNYNPILPMETELWSAFKIEFKKLGLSDVDNFVNKLENKRIIQTSSHVVVSEGPTQLAAHYLATAAMQETNYFVGTFSGIPFSNSSHPNRLYFGQSVNTIDINHSNISQTCLPNKRKNYINFVSNKHVDYPVWNYKLNEYTTQIINNLTYDLGCLIPQFPSNCLYTTWANNCNSNILTKVITKKTICFDINNVVAIYVRGILENPYHPIFRLLFDPIYKTVLINCCKIFPLFYSFYKKKDDVRFLPLYFTEKGLSDGKTIGEFTPKSVILGLEKKTLWPGLLITFVALHFCNGFRCLGGIEQLEYYQLFSNELIKAGWINKNIINENYLCYLTTGRAYANSGEDLYAVDIALGKRAMDHSANLMCDFWKSRMEQVSEKPFRTKIFNKNN